MADDSDTDMIDKTPSDDETHSDADSEDGDPRLVRMFKKLELLISRRDPEALEYLQKYISAGGDVNHDLERDERVDPLLITAIWANFLPIIRPLIAAGADVDSVNDKYLSALALSASRGAFRIFKTLIESGANINYVHEYDETPLTLLHEAAYGGEADETVQTSDVINILKLLIELGLDPNSQVSENKSTPLHLAVLRSRRRRRAEESISYPIAKFLLDNGADLTLENGDGETPLSLAEKSNMIHLVNLFDSYLKSGLSEDEARNIIQKAKAKRLSLLAGDQETIDFGELDEIIDNGYGYQRTDDIIKAKKLLQSATDSMSEADISSLAWAYYDLVPSMINDLRYRMGINTKHEIKKLDAILANRARDNDQTSLQLTLVKDVATIEKVRKLFLGKKLDPDNKNFVIKQVYKINNPQLTANFRNRSFPSRNILELWHGTSAKNLLSILLNGYYTPSRSEYKLSHDVWFGSGAYFAPEALKSLFYADNVRHSCSGHDKQAKSKAYGYIILNAVDLGLSHRIYNVPPLPKLEEKYIPSGYDSVYVHADNYDITGAHNAEVVVADTDRVLPLYIVKIGCMSEFIGPIKLEMQQSGE